MARAPGLLKRSQSVAKAKWKTRGRPSVYTDELAAEICQRLGEGESLRSICNGPPDYDPLTHEDNHTHMPDISTVLTWAVNQDHPFHGHYALARQAQAEGDAEEIRHLADFCDGSSPSEVNKARLRIDVRKWTASRLLSRRYGDRVQAEISEPGGHALGTNAAQQLANILATAMARAPALEHDDSNYDD